MVVSTIAGSVAPGDREESNAAYEDDETSRLLSATLDDDGSDVLDEHRGARVRPTTETIKDGLGGLIRASKPSSRLLGELHDQRFDASGPAGSRSWSSLSLAGDLPGRCSLRSGLLLVARERGANRWGRGARR